MNIHKPPKEMDDEELMELLDEIKNELHNSNPPKFKEEPLVLWGLALNEVRDRLKRAKPQSST